MSQDIDIIVGAKNQASKVLNDVGKDTQQLGNNISKLSSTTQSQASAMATAFKGLAVATGPLLAAFAAFKAATAAFSLGSSSIEAFNQQDQAVRGLANAIDLAGGSAEKTLQSHLDFASALQNTTNVGDEVTLAMMKQASILGVSEESLGEVTKAAIGLAEATGMSLDSALQKVQQAINGNAKSLERYIPSIRDATTEEERLAGVMALAEKGLEQKAAATNTLQGIMERSANTFGDLREKIGEVLAPIRAVIGQGLIVFAETLQRTLQPAIDSTMAAVGGMEPIIESAMGAFRALGEIVGVAIEASINVLTAFGGAVGDSLGGATSIAETFSAVVAKVQEVVIGAITFIEVGFQNFGDVVSLATAYVKVSVIGFAEDVKHYFTGVIPQYLDWFADNWSSLLRDTGNGVLTFFSNYAQQQTDLFRLGFEYVKELASNFALSLPGIIGSFVADSLNVLSGSLTAISSAFEATWTYIKSIFLSGATEGTAALQKSINEINQRTIAIMSEPPAEVGTYAERFAEIMGRDLLEGFEATTKPLPDIIARQLTDQEQSLNAQIATTGANLADAFNAKFSERMKAAGADANTAFLDSLKIGEINAGVSSSIAAASSGGSGGNQSATVSRLLTRGQSTSSIDRVAKAAEEALKIQREIAKNTEKDNFIGPKQEPLEIVVTA